MEQVKYYPIVPLPALMLLDIRWLVDGIVKLMAIPPELLEEMPTYSPLSSGGRVTQLLNGNAKLIDGYLRKV